MKRTTIFTLTLCIAALALGACTNTLHGAGQDMKNMGEKVEQIAR